MDAIPQRRADDPRIDTIIQDVATLKAEMVANTEVTKQVRDVLTSMRMLATVAKWVAAIGAGTATVYHGVEVFRHKFF